MTNALCHCNLAWAKTLCRTALVIATLIMTTFFIAFITFNYDEQYVSPLIIYSTTFYHMEFNGRRHCCLASFIIAILNIISIFTTYYHSSSTSYHKNIYSFILFIYFFYLFFYLFIFIYFFTCISFYFLYKFYLLKHCCSTTLVIGILIMIGIACHFLSLLMLHFIPFFRMGFNGLIHSGKTT